ncbi:MAG: hypothetical protein WBD00_03155 [Candidatus Omnitrophota bacterium]
MTQYILKTLGTSIGLNLEGPDDLPEVYKLDPKGTEHTVDLEIDLYRDDRGEVIEKVEWGRMSGSVRKTPEGRYCEIFDIKKKKAVCFFENEIILKYVIDHMVNKSFHVFQNFLDMIFLHAASIVVGDGAYLFVARSGGGKSTISGLAEEKGYNVLGDELCCVKRTKDKYYTKVFPSPVAIDDSGSEREVKAVFFLNKSKENGLKKMSVLDAIRIAMPEATSFYYDRSAEENMIDYRSHVFQFLSSMLENMDFGLLDFNKDGKIFSYLEQC